MPVAGYPDSMVLIPSNISVYNLLASPAHTNNLLQLDSPANGQFLTIINSDNDTAWLAGISISPLHSAAFVYASSSWHFTARSDEPYAAGGNLAGAAPGLDDGCVDSSSYTCGDGCWGLLDPTGLGVDTANGVVAIACHRSIGV